MDLESSIQEINLELQNLKTQLSWAEQAALDIGVMKKHYSAFTTQTKEQIEKLDIQLNLLASQINNNKAITQTLRYDISTKSSITELNEVKHQLSQYTPLEIFDKAQQEMSLLVTQEQLQQAQEEIVALQINQGTFLKQPDLDKCKTEIAFKTEQDLQKYCSLELLSQELSNINRQLAATRQDEQNRRVKTDKFLSEIRRRVFALENSLTQKPWLEDNKEFEKLIATKLEIGAFEIYQDKVQGMNEVHYRKLQHLKRKFGRLNQAMERLDEILLDKANKSEFKILSDALSGREKVDSLSRRVTKINSEMDNIQRQLEKVMNRFERVQSDMSSINLFSSSLRNQHMDFSGIHSHISDLQNTISSKADKSDLLRAYQNFTNKSEIQPIQETITTCKNQLDSLISLLMSIFKV